MAPTYPQCLNEQRSRSQQAPGSGRSSGRGNTDGTSGLRSPAVWGVRDGQAQDRGAAWLLGSSGQLGATLTPLPAQHCISIQRLSPTSQGALLGPVPGEHKFTAAPFWEQRCSEARLQGLLPAPLPKPTEPSICRQLHCYFVYMGLPRCPVLFSSQHLPLSKMT